MSSLAGSFLIARPMLRDPNFVQSVVLMLQHNEEGAFGLVVNRPLKNSNMPFPVFKGGPCEAPGLLMLHGHEDWLKPNTGTVAPGIFLGDAESMTRVTDPTPGVELNVRMVMGYSGWGPGQLEGELRSGAWAVTTADGEILFNTPVESLWVYLAPPSIPQPSLN
jgi:putative transcriptional regulator